MNDEHPRPRQFDENRRRFEEGRLAGSGPWCGWCTLPTPADRRALDDGHVDKAYPSGSDSRGPWLFRDTRKGGGNL